jgi:hypothetical protein
MPTQLGPQLLDLRRRRWAREIMLERQREGIAQGEGRRGGRHAGQDGQHELAGRIAGVQQLGAGRLQATLLRRQPGGPG